MIKKADGASFDASKSNSCQLFRSVRLKLGEALNPDFSKKL